ncbi:heat shock protein 90 [Hamiltosporidium tvaerminnensis]|uniref:Heat shock protein 90 n=1 Tax=Hamiltosporidium tvaerminnensis TaxID=1176355 RepID=A0A4Q9LSR7_9MICR|nr:heat shock protein 90 [Hamiltosporidium tvaerminnensis]
MTQENTQPENQNQEHHKYDVEVQSLLSIIINSVYSSKEYFLRELISNASDACDKLKSSWADFNAQNLPIDSPSSLCIHIIPNQHNKTLIIQDNGIGMSKSNLLSFLGVIANSGTKKFKEALAQQGKKADVGTLIGQFGVGFYSAFLVADTVQVITKHPQDTAYVWESSGLSGFTIQPAPTFPLSHGTQLILHLKEGESEYLTKSKLESIIKKYSMFIEYPIYLHEEVEEEVDIVEEVEGEKVEAEKVDEVEGEKVEGEKVEDEKVEAEKVDEVEGEKIEEIKDEIKEEIQEEIKEEVEGEIQEEVKEELKDEIQEEVKEEDTPTIQPTIQPTTQSSIQPSKKTVKSIKQHHVNKDKPIWTRDPKEVTQEEYSQFYKTISGDWEEPLMVKHCYLEGLVSFYMVLFIPKRSRFNMFEKGNKKDSIKLYVQNVFVTDDLEDAVPDWMSFVSGVICSNDLPMNVSREFLQGKNALKMIKRSLGKKVLELIEDVARDEEKYKIFYKEFSAALKLAVRENESSDRHANLLRYYSTKSEDKMTDFKGYVSRMKEGQKQIYVLTGLSKEEVTRSPFLSRFSDYEVLLMHEAVDEVMLQGFKKYNNYDIQRINAEGVELVEDSKDGNGKENKEEERKEFEGLCSFIKEVLSNSVEKVIISKGTGVIPCVISTTKWSHSAAMENIIRSQPGAENNQFLKLMGTSKKILELDINSALIKKVKQVYDEGNKSMLKGYVNIIFENALIGCGYKIDDCSDYSNKMFSCIERAFMSEAGNKNEGVFCGDVCGDKVEELNDVE